jgi:hypothetical protein
LTSFLGLRARKICWKRISLWETTVDHQRWVVGEPRCVDGRSFLNEMVSYELEECGWIRSMLSHWHPWEHKATDGIHLRLSLALPEVARLEGGKNEPAMAAKLPEDIKRPIPHCEAFYDQSVSSRRLFVKRPAQCSTMRFTYALHSSHWNDCMSHKTLRHRKVFGEFCKHSKHQRFSMTDSYSRSHLKGVRCRITQ